MIPRTTRFNPKRRLLPLALAAERSQALADLAKAVRYGGNPEHKRDPGDFGLTPPAAPRRGKTLCDDANILSRDLAVGFLREGLERGMVDARWRGDGWPQLVWSVTPDGVPLEAQRETSSIYHGYPMPEADPFRHTILARWKP